MDFFGFIADPSNDYLGHTIVYLQICILAIVAATLIGVAIGAAVSRSPIMAFIAVNLSGFIRAVPIIAILIVAIPFLGLGFKAAVITLVILGIPPVLLNTYTGLRGIDPAAIDAAKGMGMTSWQIATRIQAPLVTPVVAAGIRTSAVQIIATATLAAFIGAGGYGDYIVDGLFAFKYTEIFVGAVSVAALAIIVEVCMSWLQRALTPKGLRVREQVEVART